MWEGLLTTCHGFKPYLGNPAVRHYRGAWGNVAMVELCTRLAIERARTVTLHLQRARPTSIPATVPVPDWVKTAIDQWAIPASIISGTLFRSFNKAGRVWGKGFTPKVIWSIVKRAASNSGLYRVAPHDLRRTCETVPRSWRRTGADPILAWPRFGANHRALPGM